MHPTYFLSMVPSSVQDLGTLAHAMELTTAFCTAKFANAITVNLRAYLYITVFSWHAEILA